MFSFSVVRHLTVSNPTSNPYQNGRKKFKSLAVDFIVTVHVLNLIHFRSSIPLFNSMIRIQNHSSAVVHLFEFMSIVNACRTLRKVKVLASRLPNERCFLKGFQASPVCYSEVRVDEDGYGAWWNHIYRGRMNYSEINLSPVPLYLPQISQGLAWYRTRVSEVRDLRLTV